MYKVGLSLEMNQNGFKSNNINQQDESNIFRQKSTSNINNISQNNGNNNQQQYLGYINYSQPNSGRKASLGQELASISNRQKQSNGQNSFTQNNNNNISQNHSIHISNNIRHGNIQSTKDSVQPFLNQNALQNDMIKQSYSLPHLLNSNNHHSQPHLSGSNNINVSQLNGNRSTQNIRMNRSKLNPSSSFASYNSGTGSMNVRKSFYHHSNIFNLKHYKHLTEHVIDGTDIDEIKNQQRSILIREFRYKVEQYLLFSKYRKEQATKEFNNYYNKIQDQLFRSDGSDITKIISKGQGGGNNAQNQGGISFFSMNNEDQNQSLSIIQPEMNKSLLNIDANRFNYSKLSKQEASLINNMSIDIYLEDQFGKARQTQHKFNTKKLQDYILNKIKPYLSNDTEYDKKIEFYTQEYERILEKIQKQSFRIKIPSNYEPQMQPYNEYYKIDPNKIKSLPHSWDQIDDDLMNQVLEDFDSQEIQEEDEKSSYEEIEVEIEEEQPEEEIKEDIYIEEEKDEYNFNYKLNQNKQNQNNNKQEKKNKNQEKQVVQEVQVRKVMKVVKKKKKKTNEELSDSNLNMSSSLDQSQNLNSRVTKQKSKLQENNFKSAMDEYIVYRPPSPPRQKPQKQETQAQKKPIQPQPKVVQKMVGTPKQQPSRNQRIQQIQNEEQQQSPRRSQENSPRQLEQQIQPIQQEEKSHIEEEDDDEEEVIIFQEEIIIPPIQSKQSNRYDDPPNNNDQLSSQQSYEEDQRSKQNTNNALPLDMSDPPRKITRTDTSQDQSPRKRDMTIPKLTNLPSQRIQEDDQSQRQSSRGTPRQQMDISVVRGDSVESSKSIHQKNSTSRSQIDQTPKMKPEMSMSTKIQEENETPQANDQTPRSPEVNQTDFQYLNQSKIKKKVGTGLLDDLLKVSYLLEFNVEALKKQRKLPDTPWDLEFKQEEDKELFDSIFKWQYEVDLEITEMETLLSSRNPNKQKNEDSDDDDDDEGNDKNNSVHSSDITDFGDPLPDKNSLQHVSSDGLSDIE